MSDPAKTADCLVMAKPVGPRCNLSCQYCYYLEKKSLFSGGGRLMDEALLTDYIKQRFEAANVAIVHFEWHGGEPTLAGIDFFRKVVQLQKRFCPPNHSYSNGLQTNGLHINSEWAAFLAKEKFSVGLSLDGPPAFHDCFRRTTNQKPTQQNVIDAYSILVKHHVFVNVLCVLHSQNIMDPDAVYDFFKTLGVRYLQFLPLVLPPDRPDKSPNATPEQIGRFLCRVFDRWLAHDVGAMVIQSFDEALRPIYGLAHALCVHRETCGDVIVLEHDGAVYACDHFVNQAHYLGSIKLQTLKSLTNHQKLLAFGHDKRDTLPAVCKSCDVLSFCNGGCLKDRDTKGLNRLCSAYQIFFRHVQPGLTALAEHMKAGRPLRSFKAKT